MTGLPFGLRAVRNTSPFANLGGALLAIVSNGDNPSFLDSTPTAALYIGSIEARA